VDFRWQGHRCREHTLLPDTPGNRARLESLAKRIERAIQQGTFRYADFFPSVYGIDHRVMVLLEVAAEAAIKDVVSTEANGELTDELASAA